ncbi:MAG: SLBB domain-containing protein, partial [Gemmatimonadales bacterium]
MASGFIARTAPGGGRVAIDLPHLLKNRRGKDNLLLVAGDSIVIPAYVSTVQVQGQVNSPGSVTYVEGAGLDYYLDAAGGLSFKADKRRVYVEQPNGNVRA